MIVLAVDTALSAVQAALGDASGVLALHTEAMERGHQERLAPLVGELLAEAGISPGEIGRVVVTTGPGSFTGLRVGLAFAKAFALALGVPCVGVGTLEALALSRPEGETAAVIAAPRDRVYLQRFTHGRARGEPALLAIEEAREAAEGATTVGPGAALLGGDAPLQWPDIGVLAQAALTRSDLAPATPIYLREVGALTIAERRAAAGA